MFRLRDLIAVTALIPSAGLSACTRTVDEPEFASKVIGPSGGTITSIDSALTIAIQPGALEEDVELFIERSNEPPSVFGRAYLVRPNPELRFDATVTYRSSELPEDTSRVAVGAIDPVAYESGQGNWVALPVIRIDPDAKLVSGVDSQVSIFYGLLDDVEPTTTTTTTTSGGTPSTTNATTGAPVDSTTATMGSTTGAASSGATTGEGSTTDDATTDPGTSTTTTDAGTTEEGSTGTPAVSYGADIEPLFMVNCGCHGDVAPGGLNLLGGYNVVVNAPATQLPALDRVEPNNPDNSYMWLKLNNTHMAAGGSGDVMPQGGMLAADELMLIEQWILNGAPP